MREDRNPALEAHAKRMRKEMTEAEKRLWWHLRKRVLLNGSHFRRQVTVGRYIVDFASIGSKLVIEIDGAQHGYDQGLKRDAVRDRYLVENGWRVLRFWNSQVMTEMDSVIETIVAAVEGRLE